MTVLGSALPRRRKLVGVLVVASLGGLGAAMPQAQARAKHARPVSSPATPTAAAGALVQQGVLALATRDFGKAYQALAAAYRLQPSAETLYLLGVTALSSGDATGAQDLMRRYLAEVGPGGDATRHAEAQRLTERPRAASGEVSVLGPPAAFVLIDERLVGRLPLLRPLLVAAGAHVLSIERAGGVTTQRLEIQSGQVLEASLPADGTAVQVRQLPTVFVASTPTLEPSSQAALGAALTAAGMASYDAAAQSGALPPPECTQERACLLRWAAAQGVPYTLELSATATPCAVRAQLLDVAIGEPASQRTVSCAGEGGAERTLGELLPALLREGLGRPRGTLRLVSQPPGAEVLRAGRSLGKTPLVQPRFAEPLELSIELPGFHTEVRRVEVAAQSTTEVTVALKALPAGPPPPVLVWQHRRPRWRIALGITALAVGTGLLGMGISALAIDGACVNDPVAPMISCERRYATSPAGIGLVVSGAVLLGGGLATVLIPGPLKQVAVPAGRPALTEATGPLVWGQF